jgi:hypothetical protein
MINIKMKTMFFDRQTVMTKVDAGTRKVLSKFGAFVRTAAKSSIKKAPFTARKVRGSDRTDFRTVSSKPGQPPYSQSGLLKKFIFFGYDTAKKSVVIGPEKLNGNRKGEAPSLLEYGGTTTLKGKYTKKTLRYAARPYMGPALEKEKPKLPALWRNSI